MAINPVLLQNAVCKMEKLSIVMSVFIIHVKNIAILMNMILLSHISIKKEI